MHAKTADNKPKASPKSISGYLN